VADCREVSPGMSSKSKTKRKRPARLAEKLLKIRTSLRLSQGEMIRRLGLEGEMERDYISKFERDVLEPPLGVLLRYARAANVLVEVLIDDELDLPGKLSARK
jgi:transcriptional regulator with XRE-family HTH domain